MKGIPLKRRHWQQQMARLDPDTDFLEIYRMHVLHEFPWDTEQALQLAFFRTFAIPSIGGLLAQTGEFTQRSQRRYDDTALILAEILVSGPDSERGRTALRRMNGMHRHHGVGDDDMAYVIATLAVCPKRWLDSFGYRSMSELEIAAMTRYFQQMGRLVGLRTCPRTSPASSGCWTTTRRTISPPATTRTALVVGWSPTPPSPCWPPGGPVRCDRWCVPSPSGYWTLRCARRWAMTTNRWRALWPRGRYGFAHFSYAAHPPGASRNCPSRAARCGHIRTVTKWRRSAHFRPPQIAHKGTDSNSGSAVPELEVAAEFLGPIAVAQRPCRSRFCAQTPDIGVGS